VDPNKLLIGAYQGMLSKLDPYSSYIPPKMLKEFEGDTKGEFGGLGIQIRFLPVKKAVLVEQPIPGTPAFRQGVMPGDLIVQVREESTGKVTKTSEFEDVHDAVRILRGKPGTKVTITLVHGDDAERREVTIKREVIKIPGVRGVTMVDRKRKIGYVYVAYFHERMVDDLKQALAELAGEGARGVILDLRFNPGGLLDAAVRFSGLFLNGGVVVTTKGRASPEQVLRADKEDHYPNLKLVMLVNRYSASASEISAAALQHYKRAVLVGEPTYGKASVQSIIALPDGKSGLKLTTAHYYTPSGALIEGKGVQPDVTVKLSDEDTRELAKLMASKIEYPAPKPDDKKPEQAPKAGDDNEKKTQQKPQKPFKDVQLERAIEVMARVLAGQPPKPAPKPAAKEAARKAPGSPVPAATP